MSKAFPKNDFDIISKHHHRVYIYKYCLNKNDNSDLEMFIIILLNDTEVRSMPLLYILI